MEILEYHVTRRTIESEELTELLGLGEKSSRFGRRRRKRALISGEDLN